MRNLTHITEKHAFYMRSLAYPAPSYEWARGAIEEVLALARIWTDNEPFIVLPCSFGDKHKHVYHEKRWNSQSEIFLCHSWITYHLTASFHQSRNKTQLDLDMVDR